MQESTVLRKAAPRDGGRQDKILKPEHPIIKEAIECPYLQAVIKEIMRVFPL